MKYTILVISILFLFASCDIKAPVSQKKINYEIKNVHNIDPKTVKKIIVEDYYPPKEDRIELVSDTDIYLFCKYLTQIKDTAITRPDEYNYLKLFRVSFAKNDTITSFRLKIADNYGTYSEIFSQGTSGWVIARYIISDSLQFLLEKHMGKFKEKKK